MTASPFPFRVLSLVRRIPPGRVATYGDIARMAGHPGAARAVGNVMRNCNRPDVPCHRVIAAGGRLGGYGGREVLKRARGVSAVDGTRFGAMSSALRLSFGFAAPDEIDAGVERLAAAF